MASFDRIDTEDMEIDEEGSNVFGVEGAESDPDFSDDSDNDED